MKSTRIKHSSHPQHRLILKPTDTPYKCNGCKEFGFKECYRCEYENCKFYLHVECAHPSSPATHPFFRKCEFKFYKEAPDLRARYCDACGKDVRGFMYQCSHKKPYDLHPCCLKLQRTIKGTDGIELQLKNKVPSKCLKCHSKEIHEGFKGWSYVSTCGQYCFHVACVKDLILEKWEKDKLSSHKKKRKKDKEGDGGDNVELSSRLELQSVVRSCCHEVGEGLRRRKGKKWLKTAKLVLQFIICAIVGDPISAIISAFAAIANL